MTLDFLVSSFVTLLVVIDPVSLAPTFVTLTRGLPAAEHKRIALNACLLAGLILGGVALVGDWLLAQLGITLPAFRIAGGLLLFAVAFDMVLGWRGEREGKEVEQAVHKDHARRLAAFPLAIPLMAGPGAITATLLIAGRAVRGLSVRRTPLAPAWHHGKSRVFSIAGRDPRGARRPIRRRRRADGLGNVD